MLNRNASGYVLAGLAAGCVALFPMSDARAASEETPPAQVSANDEVASKQEALTVEGFDLEVAKELIDASDLVAYEKITLKTYVEHGALYPEMLEEALKQIRARLGY